MAMDKPAPRMLCRHRLQFGLRTLLVFITVFGVWFGFYMQRVRRQKEAARVIREFGGWVHYDFQELPTKPLEFDPRAKPWVPEWLLSRLGEDFFFNVAEVNLVYGTDSGKRKENSNLTNRALPHLNAFPELRQLCLKETQATDDDLRIVGALKSLKRLYFWDAKHITDAGVSHLSGLKNLENVHLSFSQISDDGLQILSGLPAIQVISVQGGRFSDRGLGFLKDKNQLRGLWLGAGSKAITDAGVRQLGGLTNLEYLCLQGTKVTDTGLGYLGGLSKLEKLYLSNTGVTDSGLEHLKELKCLKKLFLSGTQASGVSFKKARPGCGVFH